MSDCHELARRDEPAQRPRGRLADNGIAFASKQVDEWLHHIRVSDLSKADGRKVADASFRVVEQSYKFRGVAERAGFAENLCDLSSDFCFRVA